MDKEKLKSSAQSVNSFYAERKRMPSYSEMLNMFGFRSKNAVFKRVSAMVKAGFLEKDKTGRILPKKLRSMVNVLGFVKAGFPSPAEEELQDVMSLDEYLISSPQSTYLLKVDGDSMIEAGIMPGDLVLVQKNIQPKQNDIVVASVDKEWTLKYFSKKGNVVTLLSGNKKYPPITPKQELLIAGVVIANVRKYR